MPRTNKQTVVEQARSSRPSELRVVCDTMLTGLGRQLRCCGVDVRLVDADWSHEAAATVYLSPRYQHQPYQDRHSIVK